ncbi:MAG: hypothetical protein H0Z29_01900 [Candidatus Marinimicrobia bacterium]|nr:hypothetical protein [Candidatus Neomarinimicrobiota bacterium]
MVRGLLITIIAITVITFDSSILLSQSLEEKLSELLEDHAKLYLQPIFNAFGSTINSGWYHSAGTHKLFGFDISINTSAMAIPDKDKIFKLVAPDFTTTQQIGGREYTLSIDSEILYPNREAPTVFGSEKWAEINKTDDVDGIKSLLTLQLIDQGMDQETANSSTTQNQLNSIVNSIPNLTSPPGFDLKYFLLPIAQISVGIAIPMSPIKAEVIARGLPKFELEDMGEVNLLGFGGRLRLDPFIPIPMFPLRITAGGFLQNINIGDVLKSQHIHYGLAVGKDINLITFGFGIYAGYGLEKSTYEVKYSYSGEGDTSSNTEFKSEGENKSRIIAGVNLRLALINLSLQYSKSYYDILTLGIGLSIR